MSLWRTGLAAVAVVIAGWAGLASAAPEPARRIQDAAGFFTLGAVEKAEQQLDEIESAHSVRVIVETVPDVPAPQGDEVRRMSASQRQAFFTSWTRQKATAAGTPDVFVLICREPSHLRVRTSALLQRRGYSDSQAQELTSAFLSGFRQKEYDAALTQAVETLTSQATELSPRDQAAAHSDTGKAEQPVGRGGSSWFSGSGLLTILLMVGAGLLVMMLVSAIFRAFSGGMGGAGGYGGGWGGGGFFSSLLGTIGGVMAGQWLYDSFFNQSHAADASHTDSAASESTAHDAYGSDSYEGGDYGGDFGGDWGGDGGDFGGGDF